jgi:hypothetical protein
LALLPENSGWAHWLTSRVTRIWSAPARTVQGGGVDDGSDRGEVAMGPAELTEGEFAGVNADAYAEVAAGETQTFDPIMRGMSGETERRRYRNVGRSGKRILLTCRSSVLVLSFPNFILGVV